MVDVDLIPRYEMLRRQYDALMNHANILAEDDELERLDAELVELELRLPDKYEYTSSRLRSDKRG